ncbi:HNH endonuclease [Williamsia deligens]|uniref:HNH endonuclease n=1 Tax=Williamsia deligens TaxID=321325 RepID=A0ABW3GE19_9NOCA|nr:HNH endonuclease [Williamsia deligens]MCP2196298.1 HNH endonuclease [Williamsia deligens]
MKRSTSLRDKHRAIIARGRPPCAYPLCLFPGEPIDYDADKDDPRAFQADHIIPLDRGGPDTLENKAPFHRACNRHKSNHLPPAATWQTRRRWGA